MQSGAIFAPNLSLAQLALERAKMKEKKAKNLPVVTENVFLQHGWFENLDSAKDVVAIDLHKQVRGVRADARRGQPLPMTAARVRLARFKVCLLCIGVRFTQSGRKSAAYLRQCLIGRLDSNSLKSFQKKVLDIPCGSAYHPVCSREQLADMIVLMARAVLRREKFQDIEDCRNVLANAAQPVVGKFCEFHATLVAIDLLRLGVIHVRDKTFRPLLTGSKAGLHYLQVFEGSTAESVAEVNRQHVPWLSSCATQTLLCMYSKYVLMYSCGIGRPYPRSPIPIKSRWVVAGSNANKRGRIVTVSCLKKRKCAWRALA